MKIHQQPSKSRSHTISLASARVLHIGLPVILLALAVFLFRFWEDYHTDSIYALHYYPPILEHIMMSLTALIIGAFLFDYISQKERT